jgi:hypothetical protein
MKSDPQAVVDRIKEIADRILAGARLMVSFTGDAKIFGEARPVLEECFKQLPKGDPCGVSTELVLKKLNEGFTDASQIQYVARGGSFKRHGFEYRGTLKILKLILSYEYLWINIRVKGGAYGCMSSFLRTGDSYFVSYRDPNLAKTIEVYENIPSYVKTFDCDERDMTKYIVGTFGTMDTPLTPEAKGSRSLTAYLGHLSYEEIQRERDEILAAEPKDIRALSELITSILSDDCLCVIGNENAIRAESERFLSVQGLSE